MRKLIPLALGVYVLVRFTAFGLPTDKLGKPLPSPSAAAGR
jgi:hypothetical protein